MRAKINIAVFLLSLAAAFVVGILMPADTESILEENRTPVSMPQLTAESFLSGEFSTDFENYLADSVGMRSFFTAQSSSFSKLYGVDLGLSRIMEANKDLGTGDTGEKKSLLINSDKIEEIFEYDPQSADKYIAMLNFYAQNLPDGINLYSMLVPTQIEFETQLYGNVSDSQKDAIEYIYENADPRITTIDAYSALEAHKGEYIYFRTDHHWTQLGAYYAYSAFLKAKGLAVPSLFEYTRYSQPDFFGSLYIQAERPDMDPDTIIYYMKGENLSTKAFGYQDDGSPVEYNSVLYWIPGAGETLSYRLFLGGDHALLDIPTNTKNGKTILILKDSYVNAFAPWLTENYEHILLIDPRSYHEGLQGVLEQYEPDDVLIMNYVMSTTFPTLIYSFQALYQ